MLNDHLCIYPAVLLPSQTLGLKRDGDAFKATRHGDWLYANGTSNTQADVVASLPAVQAMNVTTRIV